MFFKICRAILILFLRFILYFLLFFQFCFTIYLLWKAISYSELIALKEEYKDIKWLIFFLELDCNIILYTCVVIFILIEIIEICFKLFTHPEIKLSLIFIFFINKVLIAIIIY